MYRPLVAVTAACSLFFSDFVFDFMFFCVYLEYDFYNKYIRRATRVVVRLAARF